jgi:hypothetical protein
MRLLDPGRDVEHSSISFPPCHLCSAFLSQIDPSRHAFIRQQYCSLFLLNVQSSLSTLSICSGFLSALVSSSSVSPISVLEYISGLASVLKECPIKALSWREIVPDVPRSVLFWEMGSEALICTGNPAGV